MTQTSLFDPVQGQQLKADAIAQVEAHASEEWKAEALCAVQTIAQQFQEFTSDEVWRYVEKPHEPRALGAVMVHAAKRGWIRKTNRTRESRIASQHRQPLRIWESLIAKKGK